MEFFQPSECFFRFLFRFGQTDFPDQCRPLFRAAGQQFFVLQIVFMEHRMCKVLQIPGTVLRPHFQGVE